MIQLPPLCVSKHCLLSFDIYLSDQLSKTQLENVSVTSSLEKSDHRCIESSNSAISPPSIFLKHILQKRHCLHPRQFNVVLRKNFVSPVNRFEVIAQNVPKRHKARSFTMYNAELNAFQAWNRALLKTGSCRAKSVSMGSCCFHLELK